MPTQGSPAKFVLPHLLALFLSVVIVCAALLFDVWGGLHTSTYCSDGTHTDWIGTRGNRTATAHNLASRSALRRNGKGFRTFPSDGRPKPVIDLLDTAAAGNSATGLGPVPKARGKISARIPAGTAVTTVEARGRAIDLFTYKPANYDGRRFILVFHGMTRNAEEYRDHAIAMGNRYKALIVAPRFSREQFPSERYQQGGLRVDGKLQPRTDWTWHVIPEIVAHVRRLESRADMPFWMIGHSAGGQFLIRMAGFVTVGADRIVVANPGTYLLPSTSLDYPLGFGGLPKVLNGDDALRSFLEQPVTIYLGEADTVRDDDLDTSPEADAQGRTRWERGQNVFRHGRELAARKGWTFNWKLVTVPGVDHDHEKMFRHWRCDEAFSSTSIHSAASVPLFQPPQNSWSDSKMSWGQRHLDETLPLNNVAEPYKVQSE